MPHFKVKQIGDATLFLGDCLEIMPLLSSIDIILTDPPYGVSYHGRSDTDKSLSIFNDDDTSWIKEFSQSAYNALGDNALMLSFYGFPNVDIFMSSWKDAGFIPKSHFVWSKTHFGAGWYSRSQHEGIYFLCKGKPKRPSLVPSDIIKAKRTRNEHHPTQKPLSVLRGLLLPYTQPEHLVCDPFMGSGSTALAALQTGRKFVGIEINPVHFDTACSRITSFYQQPPLIKEYSYQIPPLNSQINGNLFYHQNIEKE